MDKTVIKEFQDKILEDLKKEMESYDVPTVLRKKEEGLPTDILTTLHREMGPKADEVMGEYYFMPITGDNADVHCFTVSLSLSEELSEDNVDVIEEAIRILNYYMIDGYFLISPDKSTLIYRATAMFKIDLPYERGMEMIQIVIGVALQVVDRWVNKLLDLDHGAMTLESFIKYMPN